jgi:hypothetical protein
MRRTKILRTSRFSRTGLDELMANVRKGRIDVVGVDKLDRLGRSFQQLALSAFVIPISSLDRVIEEGSRYFLGDVNRLYFFVGRW